MRSIIYIVDKAVATIEIETKVAISRTVSIITISISINEKVEQTFAETTI